MANTRRTDVRDRRRRTISRRRFIRGVMVTSAAAGVVTLSGDAAAIAQSARATALTGSQSGMLVRVLNRLIPTDGAMPAAGESGIAAFIEKAVAAAPHLRRYIITVLTALPDADILNLLSDTELDELLRRIEAEHRDAFEFLIQATYAGYYGHPEVQAALEWVDFEAPQVPFATFDLALLDNVRERGFPVRQV